MSTSKGAETTNVVEKDCIDIKIHICYHLYWMQSLLKMYS